MQVFLIYPAKKGGLVHGTDTGKKTGCGINLTKPENVGKYISGNEMADLKEITCDKCKVVLAKRIIKEGNKEMQRMMKEEKKARKSGLLPEENIGPLQSHPTPPPPPIRTAVAPPPPRPVQPAKPVAAPAGEAQPVFTEYKPPVKTNTPQPAASGAAPIVNNPILSQFAIPVPAPAPDAEAPKPVEPAPRPVPPVPKVVAEDSFLAQFAVPKPAAPEPEVPQPKRATPPPKAAVQDDFLAQFVVPDVKPQANVSAPQPKPLTEKPAEAKPAPEVKPAPAPIPEPKPAPMATPKPAPKPAPVQSPQPTAVLDDLDALLNDLDSAFQQKAAKPAPLPETKPEPAPVPEAKSAPKNTISITAKASDITPVDENLQPWDTVAKSVFHTNNPSASYSTNFDDVASEPVAPMSDPKSAPVVEKPALEPIPAPAEAKPAPMSDPKPVPVVEKPVLEPIPAPAEAKPAPMPEPKPVPVVEKPALEPIPAPVEAKPAPMPEPKSAPVVEKPALEPIPAPAETKPAPMPEPKPVPVVEKPALEPIPAPAEAKPAPTIVPPVIEKPVVEDINDILAGMQQLANRVPIASAPVASAPKPTAPQPVFVGYNAQGQPVYQQFDTYGQPIPINEPVFSLPPTNPTESAEAMSGDLFKSAIANQRKNAKSIFELDKEVQKPVVTSIEDMLNLMGETVAEKKQREKEESEVAPEFIEYKAPPKQKPVSSPTYAAAPAPEQTTSAPMTKAEAKRQKKLDKINAEFEKQLRARGFDPVGRGR